MSAIESTHGRPSAGQRGWRLFCRGMVRVFYRRCEVQGLERVPAAGAGLLCANHASALADAVIVQAACPRPVHPLARSGLFANPVLRPLLATIQAVPIYRAQDTGGDTSRNVDSFSRCYELLARGGLLLIFPEGQSHSDPRLRPLKTGAARLALGALERSGRAPAILPVGLTFTAKGRFRSSVLVQVGAPVDPRPLLGEDVEDTVRRVTAEIQAGIAGVTLNVESWEDLEFLQELQRFFAFRRGRRELRRSLAHRFRAMQRLIETHRLLRGLSPERVLELASRLRRFHRLCARYGVRDYHLTVRYTPDVVLRYVGRSLGFLLVILPVAALGALQSALPYLATRALVRKLARGRDQYDTANMLIGLGIFGVAWWAQLAWAFLRWGPAATAIWAASLPVAGATALVVGHERERLVDNLRAFFLFIRRRELRAYLLAKRQALETELARLARAAKRGARAAAS